MQKRNAVQGAGGDIQARSLDARKEKEIISFLSDAEEHGPAEKW